jgi:xanthine dehydrogenase accessory factor
MDEIITTASNLITQGRPFVLATIIEQQGSAPRMQGARMIIVGENEIYGSIGGGLLEAKTMQAARNLDSLKPAEILEFDLTNEQASVLEMMCGGRVRVLLDYLPPNEENCRIFDGWRHASTMGLKTALVSTITVDGSCVERIEHALLNRDSVVVGRLNVSDNTLSAMTASLDRAARVQVFNANGRLLVVDPGQPLYKLYLFGAGHVSQPTAHVAAMVGFGVEVLDDRSEFAAPERFPDAIAVRTIASFDTAFSGLPVNEDTYIIIITRGHLHDRKVLAQALRTPAKYIGMIGSKRKRDLIYHSLQADGYTEDDIARVHSPIGLGIGADTPEEIAVSIVGELIAVRAAKQG